MAITDATDNTTSVASAVSSTLPFVDNNDPVGNQLASARTTQQHIIPAAVKQRNIEIDIINRPAIGLDPAWGIFGPVPSGASRTLVWITTGNAELFATTPMSFYFATANYPDYATFKQQGSLWPGPQFNMTNILCSFWQDEADSDGSNIVSKQTLYNYSGLSVYVMATTRVRFIANTTVVGTPA